MSKTLTINPAQLSAVLGYKTDIIFDALVERLGNHVNHLGCVTYAAGVKIPPIPVAINQCIWAYQLLDDLLSSILKQIPPNVRFEIRIYTKTLILIDIYSSYKESFNAPEQGTIQTSIRSTSSRTISSIAHPNSIRAGHVRSFG